jgi:hypothetical protein
MKRYLLIILSIVILSTGPIFVFAQEYTVHDGPSDIEEEVENEAVYIYVEERDELEPGLFENIVDDQKNKETEDEYQIPGYLNYKSWQFWFLLIIFSTIILVLIRLVKRLSKINTEIRRHENYLKGIKTKKLPQISEEDEIIYSEPQNE